MRPIDPTSLRAELADAVAALPGRHRHIVLLDGAAPADPGGLADELVDPLRERGTPVVRVHTGDFLRPASLRLERGHHDVESYYSEWLDTGALRREVFDRWRRSGPCSVLPTFWDPERDRATRAEYRDVPEGAVLLVDGTLLLGNGFPADLTVHLALGERVLEHRLDEHRQWTMPALLRYRAEVAPESTADIVVRMDHPARPAIAS